MDIKTVWVLRYDNGQVESGDRIRVTLNSGDTITGIYTNSGTYDMSVYWNDIDLEINLEKVASIEKIDEAECK